MTGHLSLAERMELLAEGHPRGDELRSEAVAFRKAVNGHYGKPHTMGVKTFDKYLARARRLWCDITGEPLV